jgi:hypothetical protein
MGLELELELEAITNQWALTCPTKPRIVFGGITELATQTGKIH